GVQLYLRYPAERILDECRAKASSRSAHTAVLPFAVRIGRKAGFGVYPARQRVLGGEAALLGNQADGETGFARQLERARELRSHQVLRRGCADAFREDAREVL